MDRHGKVGATTFSGFGFVAPFVGTRRLGQCVLSRPCRRCNGWEIVGDRTLCWSLRLVEKIRNWIDSKSCVADLCFFFFQILFEYFLFAKSVWKRDWMSRAMWRTWNVSNRRLPSWRPVLCFPIKRCVVLPFLSAYFGVCQNCGETNSCHFFFSHWQVMDHPNIIKLFETFEDRLKPNGFLCEFHQNEGSLAVISLEANQDSRS